MLQDVEARRKTEVEAFGGTVCSLAKKHGIEVPVNEALVKFLKALEETFQYLLLKKDIRRQPVKI